MTDDVSDAALSEKKSRAQRHKRREEAVILLDFSASEHIKIF
jgi:hypothetical protein